jgi:hypothetical protein
MLNVFTVCFFGHRYVDDFHLAEMKVFELIYKLIREKEYVEFLVGREGDFDQIVSSTIIRAKLECDYNNCSHTLVMPYLKSDFSKYPEDYENYYDTVEICEKSANTHLKSAIQICNRYMVDRSDLCIFFVHN